MEASIASIRELLEHRLAELGNVSDGARFVTDDDPSDLKLSRIARAMREEDSEFWGFLYWLRNTSAADTLAKERK